MGPNRQFWRLHFFGFQDAAVHTHTHTHTHTKTTGHGLPRRLNSLWLTADEGLDNGGYEYRAAIWRISV